MTCTKSLCCTHMPGIDKSRLYQTWLVCSPPQHDCGAHLWLSSRGRLPASGAKPIPTALFLCSQADTSSDEHKELCITSPPHSRGRSRQSKAQSYSIADTTSHRLRTSCMLCRCSLACTMRRLSWAWIQPSMRPQGRACGSSLFWPTTGTTVGTGSGSLPPTQEHQGCGCRLHTAPSSITQLSSPAYFTV